MSSAPTSPAVRDQRIKTSIGPVEFYYAYPQVRFRSRNELKTHLTFDGAVNAASDILSYGAPTVTVEGIAPINQKDAFANLRRGDTVSTETWLYDSPTCVVEAADYQSGVGWDSQDDLPGNDTWTDVFSYSIDLIEARTQPAPLQTPDITQAPRGRLPAVSLSDRVLTELGDPGADGFQSYYAYPEIDIHGDNETKTFNVVNPDLEAVTQRLAVGPDSATIRGACFLPEVRALDALRRRNEPFPVSTWLFDSPACLCESLDYESTGMWDVTANGDEWRPVIDYTIDLVDARERPYNGPTRSEDTVNSIGGQATGTPSLSLTSHLIVDTDSSAPYDRFFYPTLEGEVHFRSSAYNEATSFNTGAISVPFDVTGAPANNAAVALYIAGEPLLVGNLEESGRGGEKRIHFAGYGPVRKLQQTTITRRYRNASPRSVLEDAFNAADVTVLFQLTDADDPQLPAEETDPEGGDVNLGNEAQRAIAIDRDYSEATCVEVIDDVCAAAGLIWKPTRDGVFQVMSPELAHGNFFGALKEVQLDGILPATDPWFSFPPFEGVFIRGAPVSQRAEAGTGSYVVSEEPIKSVITKPGVEPGEASPVFKPAPNPAITSQAICDNVARKYYKEVIQKQEAGGTIFTVMDSKTVTIEPLDSVIMPESMGGESYLVDSVEHHLTSDGGRTIIDVGGILDDNAVPDPVHPGDAPVNDTRQNSGGGGGGGGQDGGDGGDGGSETGDPIDSPSDAEF